MIDTQMAALRPSFVAGCETCLATLVQDRESVAKNMAEEMDKNHDNSVDREEFIEHYREAISKVIDISKWIGTMMDGVEAMVGVRRALSEKTSDQEESDQKP